MLSYQTESVRFLCLLNEGSVVMQCFPVVEIVHERINQFQGTLIQFMPLITTVKCQKKSVTNDYSKFYMLQVISFMTNEPTKNKK